MKTTKSAAVKAFQNTLVFGLSGVYCLFFAYFRYETAPEILGFTGAVFFLVAMWCTVYGIGALALARRQARKAPQKSHWKHP